MNDDRKVGEDRLAEINAEHIGTRVVNDQAWYNDETGQLIDADYHSSDFWYGIEGFDNWDNPGPAWRSLVRVVTTVTTAWIPGTFPGSMTEEEFPA